MTDDPGNHKNNKVSSSRFGFFIRAICLFFKTSSLDKITMVKILMKVTNSTTTGHNQGKLVRMYKDGYEKLHNFHGTRVGHRKNHV